MTSFNHPLLLPHALNDTPAMYGGAAPGVCSSDAAASPMAAFTKLDADFSGSALQNGDLLVVVCTGSSSNETTWFPHMNPGRYTVATHGAASDSDWWIGVDVIDGPRNEGGTRDNLGTYIKFWHTGDPDTYSFFAHQPTGAVRCIRPYVIRGVSKRVPADFMVERCLGWTDGVGDGIIWHAAGLRAHSDYALAQYSNINHQGGVGSNRYDPDPPFSMTDLTVLIKSPGVEIEATDFHVIEPLQPWRYAHSIAFFLTSKLGIQNRIPNVATRFLEESMRNPLQGLSTQYLAAVDGGSASGDRYIVEIRADGGTGDVEHWIGTSVHLDVGDIVVARIRAGTVQGSTSSSSSKWAHGIIDASGNYLLTMQSSQNLAAGSNFTEYDGTPLKYGQAGIRYSGIPSYTGGEIYLIHRATSAGTHYIRSWILGGSTPGDLKHDFGGTGGSPASWRSHTYAGMALGVNRWPEFVETSSTGLIYGESDDFVGGIVWPWIEGEIDWDNDVLESDGVTPATVTDGGYHYAFSGLVSESNMSAGTNWTYTAKDHLTTPDTFIPFKMIPRFDWLPGGLPMAADGVSAAQLGQNHAYYAHESWSGHSHSNRIIYPYYYATEVATSYTWGDYYFEVTCVRANTATSSIYESVRVGQVGGIPRDIPTNSTGLAVPITFSFGFSGDGRFGGSSSDAAHLVDTATDIALNDVIGFRLDFENAIFYIYLNGSLVVSTPIDGVANTNTTYDMFCNCFRVMEKLYVETTGGQRYDYNFTGPFVYTKPTGTVALDWTNEVA